VSDRNFIVFQGINLAHYFAAVVFSICCIIQASVLGEPTWALGIKPDIVLLLVISWVLTRNPREGIIWGFVGGIVLDLLSFSPLGSNALALTLVAVAIGAGQFGINRAGPVAAVLVVFPASVLYSLTLLLVSSVLGVEVVWAPTITHLVLPTALLNTTVMPVVYLMAKGVGHFLHHEVVEGI
jgi:rod shape-determining protein MreD